MPQYRVRVRNEASGVEFDELVDGESLDTARAEFIKRTRNRQWTVLDIEEDASTARSFPSMLPPREPRPSMLPPREPRPSMLSPREPPPSMVSPKLVIRKEPAELPLPERPGCVTFYVVMLGLNAAFMIILGPSILVQSSGLIGGMLGLGFGFAMATLYILWARGLWLQKKWACTVVLVIHKINVWLGALLVCLHAVLFVLDRDSFIPFWELFVSIVVSGYIVHWFSENGKYFR